MKEQYLIYKENNMELKEIEKLIKVINDGGKITNKDLTRLNTLAISLLIKDVEELQEKIKKYERGINRI